MELKYEEFEEAIRLGREVEFFFEGDKYSITSTPDGWNFMKYYDYETLQVYEDEEELLNKAYISGKLLREIWNQIKVDIVF